jgi:hypothetical protein
MTNKQFGGRVMRMGEGDYQSDPGSVPRKARQWLADFRWELPEATEQDRLDLDRVMEHDEFWEWSSGKVDMEPADPNRSRSFQQAVFSWLRSMLPRSG